MKYSKYKRKKYYVVAAGWMKGIFDNWDKCKDSVYKYHGAVYKSFGTLDEAIDYSLSEMSDPGPYRISLNGKNRQFKTFEDFFNEAEELLECYE